ncbi:hypothetical protein [Streptomyces mirabilis]|uniref:hypothetical protein n=1 Tax=Streptomyces mirabilis TaxID=68239 RepID=UPI0036DB0708
MAPEITVAHAGEPVTSAPAWSLQVLRNKTGISTTASRHHRRGPVTEWLTAMVTADTLSALSSERGVADATSVVMLGVARTTKRIPNAMATGTGKPAG